MFDKKAIACTGAGEQTQGWHILRQWDAWALAKVVEPEEHNIKISNEKRFWIDLRKKACKGRVMAFELGYNTYKKWLEWLSFCTTLFVFL